MADIGLTPEQLKDLFYDYAIAILGEGADVRRSWPTFGAPAWEVTDDVIFYKIFDVPSSMSVLREDVFSQDGSPEDGNMETSHTRTLQVNWLFYGPNSWTNADLMRNSVYYQEIRDILSVYQMYLVPDFDPPRNMPELFQGLWYERWDLSVNYNEMIRINRPVNNIESVEIVLSDKSGVREEIVVE